MKQQAIAIIIFFDAVFFFCRSNSVLFRINLFVSLLVCFFLKTNIIVDYIIGKVGKELISFFVNSLYQDDRCKTWDL